MRILHRLPATVFLGLVCLGWIVGCGGGGANDAANPPGDGALPQSGPPPVWAGGPYDLVYVRQPRFGDSVNTLWPEVFHPARLDPGADLMLLHPDGSEEVLVTGGNGSVTDPFVSFDAKWVYYSYFPDLRDNALNGQRDDLPHQGADIYRIHLSTREVQQLTFGEFTPNTGAGTWDESNPLNPASNFNRLGYGILNLGPCPLPGGKIAFTSNRNGFAPPKGFTNPTLQIYVMDEDGSNVTPIAPMTISSALHPTPLRDGRLMFSSHESQGLRDRRLWGIWSIMPDGREWAPVVSAFNGPQAFHFMTQLSDGDLVVVDYYNLNNNGFGAMYRMPERPPAGTPPFFSAFPDDNPAIDQTVSGGFSYPFRMPFTPYGMYSITPFTHGGDAAAPLGPDGVTRVGKFTHPSAAPGNDLLAVWSPGPANDLNRPETDPRYDAGIYRMPGGTPALSPSDLVLIKNDPNYNEAWPRAVVPYWAVHAGLWEPKALPWLPNDGSVHPALPAGTPHGLTGTSSFYKRESFPGRSNASTFDGLDVFNTYENGQSPNWTTQGSDAGLYNNSDIWAVRVLSMEPNTHRSYGPDNGRQFVSHASERLRVLGEIALRKFAPDGSPVLDDEGNPDTSFLAKIPADTPFTFQTLDRNGMVLNMAQTWHQVRPGEMRANCGGCHAHSKQPLLFEGTAASKPGYTIPDLSTVTPMLTLNAQGDPGTQMVASSKVDVEFVRDVRPILGKCVACHTQNDANPPGNLVLDDLTPVDGVPGDYYRLAQDNQAQFGYAPLTTPYGWRQTNASRYIRRFQSRRSLLVWKIFGARLDGWTNADHPTESVPGDASTLPAGASVNDADIDFTGSAMPPATHPQLTDAEKLTIVRWIDLGCPIDQGPYGWFVDDLKPTLTISSPRPGANSAVTTIRLGAADANSGVAQGSLSVRATFQVGDVAAGQELAATATDLGDGRFEIPLGAALPSGTTGTVHAEVRDNQGNITRVAQRFSIP